MRIIRTLVKLSSRSRGRRILRNLLALPVMIFLLVSFAMRTSWGSEILLTWGCTDFAIMQPGGVGDPAICQGYALCINSKLDTVLMAALCSEDAWCPSVPVMNDVIVDSTSTSLRCRGTAVNSLSGKVVHTMYVTEGCERGEVKFELKIPMFENCLSPLDIPRLPPDVCFTYGYYWNTSTNSCSETDPCLDEPWSSTCWDSMCEVCLANGGAVCFQGLCSTPIVVDIQGNGFNLTNVSGGVDFDIFASGTTIHTSWTAANSDDAWLVLDRNNNGVVDTGAELFGSATPQPQPPPGEIRNGFLALVEYDKPVNGGNGDKIIDHRDIVFSNLQLWQDANHNGVCDPNELHSLPSLNVESISLDYKESKKTDEHGNHFRYRAKVDGGKNSTVARWAWDVFLLSN